VLVRRPRSRPNDRVPADRARRHPRQSTRAIRPAQGAAAYRSAREGVTHVGAAVSKRALAVLPRLAPHTDDSPDERTFRQPSRRTAATPRAHAQRRSSAWSTLRCGTPGTSDRPRGPGAARSLGRVRLAARGIAAKRPALSRNPSSRDPSGRLEQLRHGLEPRAARRHVAAKSVQPGVPEGKAATKQHGTAPSKRRNGRVGCPSQIARPFAVFAGCWCFVRRGTRGRSRAGRHACLRVHGRRRCLKQEPSREHRA